MVKLWPLQSHPLLVGFSPWERAAELHTRLQLWCIYLVGSKWSAQRGTVTQVCGPEYQERHACFNNQPQEKSGRVGVDNNKADISSPFSLFQVLRDFFLPNVCFSCSPALLSSISPVCRATSNNKVKEMVLLELSYVNSNLQLLMGQLEGLNSSVEVYQNTQWVQMLITTLATSKWQLLSSKKETRPSWSWWQFVQTCNIGMLRTFVEST